MKRTLLEDAVLLLKHELSGYRHSSYHDDLLLLSDFSSLYNVVLTREGYLVIRQEDEDTGGDNIPVRDIRETMKVMAEYHISYQELLAALSFAIQVYKREKY
jgi:hypothetical protein